MTGAEADGDGDGEARRDGLLAGVQAAIKALLRLPPPPRAGHPVPVASVEAAALLEAVSRAFHDGLLPDVRLWDFLQHLEHAAGSTPAPAAPRQVAPGLLTPEAQAALWLRTALTGGRIAEAVAALTALTDVQEAYYRPDAFLRSEHHGSALAAALLQLRALAFADPVDPSPHPDAASSPSPSTSGLARGLSHLRGIALETAARTQRELSDWVDKREAEKGEVQALRTSFSHAAKETHGQIAHLQAALRGSEAARADLVRQLAIQATHWRLVLPRAAELGIALPGVPDAGVVAALGDEERVRLAVALEEATEAHSLDRNRHEAESEVLRGKLQTLRLTVASLEAGLRDAEAAAATACRHMNVALLQVEEQEARGQLLVEHRAGRAVWRAALRLLPAGATAAPPGHCAGCGAAGAVDCEGLTAGGGGGDLLPGVVEDLRRRLELAREEIQARNEVLQSMIVSAEGAPATPQEAADQRDHLARLREQLEQALAHVKREQGRATQLERELRMERELNRVNYGSMTGALEKAKAQAKELAEKADQERKAAETAGDRAARLEGEVAALRAQLVTDLEAERHSAAEVRRRAKTLETELLQARSAADTLQTELESAKARLRFHEREAAAASAAAHDCRGQLAAQTAAAEGLRGTVRDLRAALEDARQDADTERSLMEGRMKELQVQHDALMETVEQRNGDIVALTHRLDALQEEVATLRDDPLERKCQLCGADFTLTRRRHHCRACSRPTCDTCAPLRAHPALPQFQGKPTRICRHCA